MNLGSGGGVWIIIIMEELVKEGVITLLLNRAQRKANLSTILLVTKYSNNFEKNA